VTELNILSRITEPTSGDVKLYGRVSSLLEVGIGFPGDLVFDNSKPDGMPVKLLDSHKLEKLGWKPGWSFGRGIEILFRELGNVDAIRFLFIPRKKRVESVKRHRDWQQTLDKDTFFDEIFGDHNQEIS
jgi:hypothetical protein